MTERSTAFLEDLEREAGLADGLLTRRFLPVFTLPDPRLDAIPQDELGRIRGHVLAAAAAAGRPQRPVDEHTMMSPAEVQLFRRMLQDAGERILGDEGVGPQTRETLRYLCPVCADDGTIPAEEIDVEAPLALPGTAGALRTEPGDDA